MNFNIFRNRKRAAQAVCAPTMTKKETQYVRIVRLLSQNNRISPRDCIRNAAGMITTKLSTRIGEIENKTGIVFNRKRDPKTRFMVYSCYSVDDLETLRAAYLPEYKPLNSDR